MSGDEFPIISIYILGLNIDLLYDLLTRIMNTKRVFLSPHSPTEKVLFRNY